MVRRQAPLSQAGRKVLFQVELAPKSLATPSAEMLPGRMMRAIQLNLLHRRTVPGVLRKMLLGVLQMSEEVAGQLA